jgi:hypothetical protein
MYMLLLKNLWTDYSKAKGKHKIIRIDDYEVTYEVVDGSDEIIIIMLNILQKRK